MQPFLVVAAMAAAVAVPQSATAQDIVVVAPAPRPYDAPRLPDPALAELRGGISLPNGLQVAIGIDIQTRVDTVLVLHTVYASDGPTAGVRVYTEAVDPGRVAPGTVVVRNPGENWGPSVVVTRTPAAGTSIVPGPASSPAAVNLVEADPGSWLNGIDQTPIPLDANGAPTLRHEGSLRLTADANGSVVQLETSDLQVRHLIGQATGTAIANTGNDRAVETISSVNIDLQGGAPLAALAGAFVADRIALDVMGNR